ncbi:putative efflux pump antibiotic resistance protein [Massarina eburnea CBS 473.64]|uniref:Putative efflux pump antibiotic resistance protein n=1 Tax=Massarina eburnea CBS 473.64 TaxID=1395130 RepID=A0A6A6RGC9_9PLEO|nr:putative efflux pump antibiotic resistance protein [Massarina eburnea CBS 473.64]
MSTLYLTMFIVALDKTIIGTAIPRITDDFHSLLSIGWYASSYLLTLCGFQLLWGRIYTFYPAKTCFIIALLIFEVGSAMCGAAPTSNVFILGRAIAGLGSAGIMSGSVIVMIETVPLEKRPGFQGLLGGTFAIASVVGPLLGGVFTEHVSWRWCFYINLPCGAVAVAIQLLVFKSPAKEKKRVSLAQQFRQLDPIGMVFFLPSIICLLLALQWGGTTYAWSSWRIILLLVLFAVLAIGFVVVQVWMPETATIPLRILKQRTIAAGAFYSFTAYSSMFIITYYIPTFFQALKDFSPTESGEALLPFIVALFIGAIVAGGLVQHLGYPSPFMILSSIILTVGAGMISTWSVTVGSNRWIGFQFIVGLGTGLGMQQPNLLAQIVLPKEDAAMGVTLPFFAQNLGGAVFVSVAQNLFTVTLATQVNKIPGVHVSRQEIVEMGATSIRNLVPEGMVGLFLDGYRIAIRNVVYLGVGLAAASIIGSVLVEFRSVKEGKTDGGEKGGKEAVDKADV